MSMHNQQQFKYFTKAEMDLGLLLHGRKTDVPSHLSDAFRAGADWAAGKILKPKLAAKSHVLYTTQDDHRPLSVCDRNGEVVLSLCKKCGKAEAELSGPCEERPAVYMIVRDDDESRPVALSWDIVHALRLLEAKVDEWGHVSVVSASILFSGKQCYGAEDKKRFLADVELELIKYCGGTK